ncbi:Ribosome biogenesis protein [Naganishia cerealis]|uniref:Ribosome biogenesis protein n=1 Tax=Naganishia cerealis TaxID=610337 RepID=A0ACC2WAH8_9TREE|nr:Ribosome biogenesis protein [Naganishia cerealis]
MQVTIPTNGPRCVQLAIPGGKDKVSWGQDVRSEEEAYLAKHTFKMNEYMEEHRKKHGRRLDHEERQRKRTARESHKSSAVSQKLYGIKAKLHHAKRHSEKVQLKKTLKAHDERNVKSKDDGAVAEGALPTYLLDRENQRDAKALSTSIKERRKDKAAKYSVPLPKVRGISEEEMFKVLKTGSKKSKSWKRMVNKATFVGEGFTRKPVKMERFIRPMAMRYKKANVTHPDLKATFQLQIIGVKKNPQSPLYTQLGVLTKGTVIEVNVAELGMVTTGGKVVWASTLFVDTMVIEVRLITQFPKEYAQITNNPENDGCINAVLCKCL